MFTGAFIMMDALGWKGITRRPGVRIEHLLPKLRKLRDVADSGGKSFKKAQKAFPEKFPGMQVRVACLSDTIALGVGMPHGFPGREPPSHHSIVMGGMIAARVLAAAGQPPIPLGYRGCLTFGDFDMDDRFLVGPAVDEAAELYEQAEASIVCLSPKAKSVLDALPDDKISTIPEALRDGHDVPLKGGQFFGTWVVSPFPEPASRSQRAVWTNNLLATFSGPLAVEVKKQNTKRILDRIDRELSEGRKPRTR